MKKINISDVCVEYTLDSNNFTEALSKGASIAMACSTCIYNLFTYCHFEDREDPIVIRALEGNYHSKKVIHENIRLLEEKEATK